jgi:hypothetical protein
LPKSGPASFAVRRVKLGFLHPAQERCGPDTYSTRRILGSPLGEQGGDGLFFLSPKFGAVTPHLLSPAINWPHRRFVACSDGSRIALPFRRTRAIHVVTATIAAQGETT